MGSVQMFQTSTELSAGERGRGVLARWGIGRGRYAVAPGLYAVGRPGPDSHVLVTANYKLSFDSVREALKGWDAWLLALDTKGINVWCAAGKGAFGTEELVRRIRAADLGRVVSRRALILPQLGAVGVAGFKVAKQTGFRVVFGPVRARDIGEFLRRGLKASPAMRRVEFPLGERLMLAPVEFLEAMKFFSLYLLLLGLWVVLKNHGGARDVAGSALPVFGAVLTGVFLVPAFLPWLPFRAFALKGWALGLAWALAVGLGRGAGAVSLAAHALLLPAVTAFLALNYTGSTTFTSQSGVNREIRLFARPMALAALAGIAIMVVEGAFR